MTAIKKTTYPTSYTRVIKSATDVITLNPKRKPHGGYIQFEGKLDNYDDYLRDIDYNNPVGTMDAYDKNHTRFCFECGAEVTEVTEYNDDTGLCNCPDCGEVDIFRQSFEDWKGEDKHEEYEAIRRIY